MNYMQKLKSDCSFDEAKSTINKALILEFMDTLPDEPMSHTVLTDFLEHMGRREPRDSVLQYIAELETEGLVTSRNIGFEGWPFIVAKLCAPLADLPAFNPSTQEANDAKR